MMLLFTTTDGWPTSIVAYDLIPTPSSVKPLSPQQHPLPFKLQGGLGFLVAADRPPVLTRL